MDEIISRLNSALEGRYAVGEEIGQGGMAVVYLAEDLKHRRKVALKVLRSELAAIIGGERFLKEIEVTANLQHPNILPLYDSGNADGFLYYVMPLLEGETLRAKLDREHQLRVEEAIEIAKAVAAAVGYAHRHGVIHRDLKPSNILLHDGQALVSDFGIALALRRGAAETRLTETGLSLGTPHYMSPEQAAGDRELDARSDLYSLGALTYEMLVGEPPHVAKTAQAVVAKILTDTPAPIRRTRELVPANVEGAVAKALARSPADRFASVAEFAAALTNPGFTLPAMAAAAGGLADRRAGLWRRWGPVAAGVAVIAIILGAWGWLRTEEPPGTARYNLAFLPGEELVDLAAQTFDVSRGGEVIVYVGPGQEGNQLWVKHHDDIGATPLPGTTGASCPSISPNGGEVAFISAGELRKMPVTGGVAVTLADSAVLQVAWMDDGLLAYTSRTGLRMMGIPSVGGDPVSLWPNQPDSVGAAYPTALPGSRGLIFKYCLRGGCASSLGIWILDLRTGEVHELVPDGIRAWYLESGHLVFVGRSGAVFAAPFDMEALELTGAPVPVLEGVKVQSSIYPDMALTPDGTLLYLLGAGAVQGPEREMVWVSREGMVRPVDPGWTFRTSRNRSWALSPDGTRLAIGLHTEEGDDVWIKELDGGTLLRLTHDPAEDAIPRWSRDGQLVYFISGRGVGSRSDLYVQRADGAGDPLPVLVRDTRIWEHAFSPDGEWLVARVGGTTAQTGARNIVAYRLEGDTAEVPLMTSDYDEVSPSLSPDGRWLAYASQETGAWEVYVRPFPDVASGKWPVSRGGGFSPLWAHSGRDLFYLSADSAMMVATVGTGESFQVADRQRLFSLPPGFNVSQRNVLYDVTRDDRQFIGVRDVSSAVEVTAPLILVEKWLQEVKELVARQGG